VDKKLNSVLFSQRVRGWHREFNTVGARVPLGFSNVSGVDKSDPTLKIGAASSGAPML